MSYAKKMLDALEAGQMETARQLFTQVLAHDDDKPNTIWPKNFTHWDLTVRLSVCIRAYWVVTRSKGI